MSEPTLQEPLLWMPYEHYIFNEWFYKMQMRHFGGAFVQPEYNHAEHKYYLGNIVYTSATQLLHQYSREFDTAERSAYMADRWGQTPEYWVAQWDKTRDIAAENGTAKHDHEEQFLYNQGFTSVHGTQFQVFKRGEGKGQSTAPYYTLEDGCYPELMFWRHDCRIAGRADKPTIETISGVRYLHIEDYKTSRRIRKYSYQDPKTKEYQMMKGPLSHLMDCEWSHYCIQLSLYQYMGEWMGFEPGERRIIHFPHEIEGLGTPDPEIMEVPYLRNEILAITNGRN